VTEARSIPVPETDGTPAGDMMPMLILATLIPSSVEDYRRRGFSEDMIDRSLKAYAGGMSIVESRVGRPGVNKTYYSWLGLYAKTAIFNYGGFNFELRKTPPVATYLRNRQDGQVTVVMCSGTFHRDGMVLGTAGYADPEGSFAAEFRETEDAWYGHPVVEHRVSSQLTCFEKAQWECALAPGEDVLSIHIPRKTDLSAEAIDKAISGAMEIAKNSFPEFHIKTVFCSSWLMEPYLEKILGQKSRIYGFQSRFHRYPVKSAGKEVFSFVFTKNYESLEELPENTTLERALKQRYLNGEFVYCFAGAIL